MTKNTLEKRGQRMPWRMARLTFILATLALLAAPLLTFSGASAQQSSGVATLTGTVTVTNPFIISSYPEHYMALIDLTAFVKRKTDLPLPSSTQVTTGIEGDWSKGGSFALPLPIAPQGEINDVGHGQGGTGVQVYSLDLQVNTIGDPYLGPFEFEGWSTDLTSLDATVDTGEVVGGRMIVWAPDDKELFPTGFGTDGKLFTADDPVGPIQPGWTVVDLDQQPFAQVREATVSVAILEGDAALKDLSNLTYTQAFDQLIKELRQRYPFTAYKHLDWDQIVSDIRPQIQKAEQDHDTLAFNRAMLQFTVMTHDGHVGVSPPAEWMVENYGGGLGVYLGVTDDRQITLRCVTPGLPAANAGIKEAAQIVSWNGEDPLAVLARTPQLQSASTDFNAELDRLSWMGRMKPGTEVTVDYRNPGSAETKTAKLVAVDDPGGLSGAPCGETLNDPAEMPVTVKVLPSGLGYIKVNTFSDDMTLMTHAWEWALQRLNALQVPGLIVDVRLNGGGSGGMATYFAGSFYDKSFVLNTMFLADDTGKQEDVGDMRVDPAPVQWTKPVAVLINPGCASACEIFAAAIAHDPKHLIVGRSPSAGVEAGVEPWQLPDDLYFQAPVIAFHNPDGSIFLEGVGVVPNVRVPNTPENLLVNPRVDAALDAAVQAMQKAATAPAATQAA